MDFQPSGATASSCLSKLRQAAALLSVALLGFVTACGGSGTGTGGGTGTMSWIRKFGQGAKWKGCSSASH